jgi:hypothetical protein
MTGRGHVSPGQAAGFVTSVVLLLVQFGTSEFSPRFRRDRTLK